MRFAERKEFTYDPVMFGRLDTVTALKIHKEATLKFSGVPYPQFFEVDTSVAIDPLWHMQVSNRVQYTKRSPLSIAAINTFQRPDWRLTKLGITPQRRDQFTLSNLLLQEADYWPVRGDGVFWNGYRYMIINVVLDPKSYWGQTGVWLGLLIECVIPLDGDAKPLLDPSQLAPAETQQTKVAPEL